MIQYFRLHTTLPQSKHRVAQLHQWCADHFNASGQVDWHAPIAGVNRHALVQDIYTSNHDEAQTDHEADVMVAPPQLQKPPQYAVIVLNDDYTPMDFVIEILQDYFSMDLERATQTMLNVHHQGRGIAGIYPRDIAETKATQVNQYARAQGHPLLCQIEAQY